MSNQPLQTLKGFRDFLPLDKRAREYIATKIKETFELYGFEPIETPTLEYASLLLGKYGNEADKLVYTFEDRGGRKVGLRYDQTVPSARILAQYQSELPKYFRRYNIQNVFRADKPQQGRFREFTQCDPDIYGTTSPIADAEILAVTYFALKNIGFPEVIIKINDRQILFDTLKSFTTDSVDVFSLIQTIDKLDKVGESGVIAELIAKGVSEAVSQTALNTILKAPISDSLATIINLASALNIPKDSIQFTPSLARGLDYYTGMIFEVSVPQYGAGSLGGGGRYDTLIEQLGGPNIPAVGFAFGFDRVVEAAKDLNIIPDLSAPAHVLIGAIDEKAVHYMLGIASSLRQNHVSAEIYPVSDKPGKILGYANKKHFPYVALIGLDELEKNVITLKNMTSGEQQSSALETLLPLLAIG